MANTTNFGWETPDDTDLVKDGALAMRTLGNAIDTSFVDLKGGTTDQVLAKNSNTDLDFKWVTPNDADAIQNTIVDAKGDLITATAADTPARLAVGTNGQILTADSSTATGLKWAAASAGSFNLISRQTFSNVATASFEGVLSSTYDSYIISIEKVYGSTGGADLLMTLLYSTNTEQTTDYYYNTVRVGTSNTNSAAGPASSWMLSDSSSANTNQAGHNYVYLTQVNNDGAPQFSGHGIGGDAFTSALFAGLNTTSRSYTGVRFKMHSGNIYANIAIYGLAKS